jgi:DNA repair protein RadC
MPAITSWATNDRPREKMLQHGATALSDAELIAIMIGSGTPGRSAVALAQEILSSTNQSLHDLGRCSVKSLQRFKGIGEAKAITIAAALELGRRRQASDLRQRVRVSSSKDAYDAIAPYLADLQHEEIWLLALNQAGEIMSRQRLGIGGMAGVVVDPKVVFRTALEVNAMAIIMVHNHPSGQTKPSQADIDITRKLVTVGKSFDLPVLDHLIIGRQQYFSFADEGMLG